MKLAKEIAGEAAENNAAKAVAHDEVDVIAARDFWAASEADSAVYWAASDDVCESTNAVYWALYYSQLQLSQAVNLSYNKRLNELTKQINILKDIYNPNLISLTFPTKAIQLAEEIYNTNNQTTRLILSDFLEEFHFPEELYAHLKQPTHHKGCWVIDQILDKS